MGKIKRSITPAKLGKVWAAYTEFQTHYLAPSTIARDYHKVRRILEKMPRHLTSAVEMRDWIASKYSGESTRRIIQQLNACCDWAVTESEALTFNPFVGLGKRMRRNVGDTTWAAFTRPERDLIIAQFREQHPQYAPWVEFLFLTGCRPEEAAALRWLHLTPDRDFIHFRVAAPVGHGEQRTKNRKERMFKVGPQLRALLDRLQPVIPNREALIFTGVTGKAFEYHNFNTRQWRPLVTQLVEEGKVFRYLSQYHCRHTWITLALESGLSVAKVSYYCGTSAPVILKHYASARPDPSDVLEF